jgi:quercetin dioxygenase-like cupin family protein
MTTIARSSTSKGSSDWFTGDVWLDALGKGQGTLTIGSVHFTPGARTAWHSHSVGQTLYVTEGEGLVQARGEDVQRVVTGEIVRTPGGEWHWHGAAADHFMTHLSLTEGDTEWGDHVGDDEYIKAPGRATPDQE